MSAWSVRATVVTPREIAPRGGLNSSQVQAMMNTRQLHVLGRLEDMLNLTVFQLHRRSSRMKPSLNIRFLVAAWIAQMSLVWTMGGRMNLIDIQFFSAPDNLINLH